ncbi:MAG: arsenical pump rane protein, partial [Pseudonocardiales bacterium]|nr:arsenical pump rane protein [Pseudonocardiales bacterium]
MHGAAAETLAIVLLALTLAVAVLRPRGLSEAVVAVPAALVLVASGVVPLDAATQRLREIGPTVGFLAAILVFGHLCAEAGVFDYLGSLAARASHGSAPRLLVLVVVIAAAVTAVLTLDATVVLLTPVVLTTAARLGVSARPYAYACTRLANSASLLLPVSNLT